MDRYDYLGLSYTPCEQCGYDFLYQERSKYAAICAGCVRSICAEPWNHCFEVYRALRPDEDVMLDGFRSKNPQARVSVSTHVERGSYEDTQYISMTSSLEVAAFFAVKGYHQFAQSPARIAVLSVPHDYERFEALGQIPYGNGTARNFARRFHEIVYTEETVEQETTLEKILILNDDLLAEFENNVHNIADFKDQFDGSLLADAIQNSLAKTKLSVELDLVGLHHYSGARPSIIRSVKLVLENDNEYDDEAVCVMGQANPDSNWFPIGHLSWEHARIARKLLTRSNNLYRVVGVTDLKYTCETSIHLLFEVPDDNYTQLIDDSIRDSCGSVHREPNLQVRVIPSEQH